MCTANDRVQKMLPSFEAAASSDIDENKHGMKRGHFFAKLSHISSTNNFAGGAHSLFQLEASSPPIRQHSAMLSDAVSKRPQGLPMSSEIRPPRCATEASARSLSTMRTTTARHLLTTSAVEAAEAYQRNSTELDSLATRTTRSSLAGNSSRSRSCSATAKKRVTFTEDCKKPQKLSMKSLL